MEYNIMSSTNHADFDKAVQSRMSGSATAAVLLLPVTLIVYICLVNFSILHPITWIAGTISTTLTLSVWLHAVILSVILVLVSITSWKHFTVSPIVCTSRLAHLYHCLRPEKWIHGLGHGLAGSVSAWLLTGVCGGRYRGMTETCDTESHMTCMNEYHVFVVCYGTYVGVAYSVDFFRHQQYHVVFPNVKQPRFLRVKHALLPTLTDNLVSVLYQVRYYYPVYWLLGGWVRHWICGTLNLYKSSVRLDSFYGLLDVPLLWSTVLTGVCIRLCWNSAVVLYQIFITMPYQFPVETVLEGKTSLVDAMAANDCLLSHHGFSHLYHAAQFSAGQRREMFCLSQPGGHPRNWKCIVTECLRVLTDLSEQINHYNDGSPIMMKNGQTSEFVQRARDGTTLTFRPLASKSETIVPPYDLKDVNQVVATQTLFDKMMLDLRKKPAIAYFVSEIPELQSRKLFSTCQIQIWALEALSLLICASLQEDEYGVVQKHVNEILVTILSLQEAMERHAKLGLNGRGRLVGGRKPDLDSALRNTLKQSLKTALYRITQTFGVHVSDFNLPYEYKRWLENFLEYKEWKSGISSQ